MKPTILVIDDSSFVHVYVKNLMTVKGYRICSAYDWPEVRMALKHEENIVLCLIDINLPGMRDGDELAKGLRMHSKLKEAKLVFYSGTEADSLAKKTEKIGLDGYIVKGDSDREFVDALKQYLPSIDQNDGIDDEVLDELEQNLDSEDADMEKLQLELGKKIIERNTPPPSNLIEKISITTEERENQSHESIFEKNLDQAFDALHQQNVEQTKQEEKEQETKKKKSGWWSRFTGK